MGGLLLLLARHGVRVTSSGHSFFLLSLSRDTRIDSPTVWVMFLVNITLAHKKWSGIGVANSDLYMSCSPRLTGYPALPSSTLQRFPKTWGGPHQQPGSPTWSRPVPVRLSAWCLKVNAGLIETGATGIIYTCIHMHVILYNLTIWLDQIQNLFTHVAVTRCLCMFLFRQRDVESRMWCLSKIEWILTINS